MKKPEKGNDMQVYIYRRFITRNGKRIYPKRAKAFKIPVK